MEFDQGIDDPKSFNGLDKIIPMSRCDLIVMILNLVNGDRGIDVESFCHRLGEIMVKIRGDFHCRITIEHPVVVVLFLEGIDHSLSMDL